MNFENWILIIYEPKTNIQKKKKNAKWSNFNSIEPNIVKWLYYIHQIQKKKTMKNKNYQFLNFLSNQIDFGSEKRNREFEAKKGKKRKKKKKQTWIWMKTPRGLQKALLREKRNESKASNAGIVAPSLFLKNHSLCLCFRITIII